MTTDVPGRVQSTASIVDALRSAQKAGAGVPAYTRWVNRYLARYVAAVAFRAGLTANHVTLISAALSTLGLTILVLAPIHPLTGVAASLLLVAGYVLDSADGQVARLSGTSSPAGEWLDHVIDSVRTPAIHLAVVIALWRHDDGYVWVQAIAIAYALLSVGQFMSQILAEQLAGKSAGTHIEPSPGVRKSLLLLPTDMGALCWVFVLWGVFPVFAGAYALLFVVNAIHMAASMWRKYRKLSSLAA